MNHLKFYPAVCAVENEYQILIPVDAASFMWAEIGGRRFSDASCGVMRSDTRLHRITVPMALLDAAGAYTLHWQKIIDRKPYFPETEPEEELTIAFRPLPTGRPLHIYHIADVHNVDEPAIAAGAYFGADLDLLILNGDVPDSSGNVAFYDTIYHVIGDLTRGEIPVVSVRGNHDLRGIAAERMAEYMPNRQGNTFYSFRVGPIWGVVLDCGEDKRDTNPEYGGSVACHEFRLAETDYLRDLIARADREFDAPGVQYKLVICHIPFCTVYHEPFNIENEIYTEWCRLLRESVKPDLFLAGHEHTLHIVMPGEVGDDRGVPCPLIVGSKPEYSKEPGARQLWSGAALILNGKNAKVQFTDRDKNVIGEKEISLA